MLIHNKIANSRSNGPGDRAVVWVQGCVGMNCIGCWNSETHSRTAGKETSIFELADWILQQDVEGVTFSGGEPLQQALSLELVIAILREERPSLSIGSFTGYTLKELREGKFSWWHPALNMMIPGDPKLAATILKQMDFIIAGRYNQAQACSDKPLCGSRNQEVHFLSNRYSAKDLEPNNSVEIFIDKESGLVQITGFPGSPDLLDQEMGIHKQDGPDDGMLAAA